MKHARRECELMTAELHPALMPLIDTLVTPVPQQPEARHVYMLMPYYRGGSVWDAVSALTEREQRVSSSAILAIVRQARTSNSSCSMGPLQSHCRDRSCGS
jgi:aminoglycoside phosphotransferase (APT) family kinase protein